MLRSTIIFLLALLAALPSVGGPVSTPHVTAKLLLDRSHVRPGEEFRLGLHLRMKEGWHTYWKHPGDSGEATTIDWVLPDGFTAGPILWPQPQRISMEPLTTYGYEGDVLLLVPMRAPAAAVAGSSASMTANVYWMVCEEICIPEEVTLDISVPIAAEPSSPGASATLFDRSTATLPVPSDGWQIRAAERGDRIILRARPPEGFRIEQPGISFFATTGPLIEYSAPQPVSLRDGELTIELTRSPYAADDVRRLSGVLHAPAGWVSGGPVAVEIDAPIDESPPIAPVASERPPLTLLIALGFAFLGGMVLNLMPCVFPVVSLKILAFMQHSGDEPRRVRLHGLSFAGGVLLAFWILAGLLLALRAAGEEIGWGFQLQSPAFVAAMAFLLFALGLSLSGVMDIGISLTRLGGAGAGRAGYGTSALNGMLATVVATPCTAPFMGAALGFALTQSAMAAFLIFTALGAGMAAPYVALSLWPALLRFLPRSGQWMVRFKQLMAFPLFATVAWLVWVFGHQTGVDGILRLLLGLTLVGAAAWVWGSWSTFDASSLATATARSVAVALLASGFLLSVTAEPVSSEVNTTGVLQSGSGVQWEPWSEERVAELRAEGRPVFINFTAAWCLTCKVNERVAFSSAEVSRIAGERNIAMLKADWTNRDASITRALSSFGRSGVPLYVVYEADASASPRLLPEILSPGILVQTFSQLH
ncbi:MAG TPA: protein-disulfide reductase DsbD domain-containing protein [Thermoanaerobaculia bacterium]|nr:protein-disulfide reductase DsbD domain-containing protein [Thermoanaerobaculia bacterium]